MKYEVNTFVTVSVKQNKKKEYKIHEKNQDKLLFNVQNGDILNDTVAFYIKFR